MLQLRVHRRRLRLTREQDAQPSRAAESRRGAITAFGDAFALIARILELVHWQVAEEFVMATDCTDVARLRGWIIAGRGEKTGLLAPPFGGLRVG
jgi:hypothetical protein